MIRKSDISIFTKSDNNMIKKSNIGIIRNFVYGMIRNSDNNFFRKFDLGKFCIWFDFYVATWFFFPEYNVKVTYCNSNSYLISVNDGQSYVVYGCLLRSGSGAALVTNFQDLVSKCKIFIQEGNENFVHIFTQVRKLGESKIS